MVPTAWLEADLLGRRKPWEAGCTLSPLSLFKSMKLLSIQHSALRSPDGVRKILSSPLTQKQTGQRHDAITAHHFSGRDGYERTPGLGKQRQEPRGRLSREVAISCLKGG